MMSARVTSNTGLMDTELSQQTASPPPHSGKVRVGIKVPTAETSRNPELMSIYQKGLQVGASFDAIIKVLKSKKGCPNTPLRPTNCPTFRVVQDDFQVAGSAQKIMDMYGEQRKGDDLPQLYTFPIAFSSENFDEVFSESFKYWKASSLYRWSEPDPETGVLMCMKRGYAEKLSKRRWGGRPIEVDRECNPNDCAFFESGKQCAHHGAMRFYIDGIGGVDPIVMEFRSIYASLGIMDTLRMVKSGLGKISGVHDGKPIFWISKTLKHVVKMNYDTGKPERVSQWIVTLAAPNINMVDLMRISEKTYTVANLLPSTGNDVAIQIECDAKTDKPRSLVERNHSAAEAHEANGRSQTSPDDENAPATEDPVVIDCATEVDDNPETDDPAVTTHDKEEAPYVEAEANEVGRRDDDISAETKTSEKDIAVRKPTSEQEGENGDSDGRSVSPARVESKTRSRAEAGVPALRKVLGGYLKKLEWGADDIAEYLEANGYSKDDMQKKEPLERVISELKPIVDAI